MGYVACCRYVKPTEIKERNTMRQIKCTPGDLDDIREEFKRFSHFTVRRGKVIYHMLSLANNSCGIYYAWRIGDYGLEGRRALEPTDEIICWGE